MKFSDLIGNDDNSQQEMKATDLLRQDHDRVRELFAQYRSMKDEDAGDGEKQQLFQQIERELVVHTKAEEEIFYPAVKKAPADDAKDLVLEAREEHGIVDILLEQLRRMRPKDESFDAKMTVLMESVEHHADEEENEMFPAAEELGEKTLDRLGKQIARRKAELVAEASSRGRGRSARGTSSRRRSSSSRSAASRSTASRSRTSRSSRSKGAGRSKTSVRSTSGRSAGAVRKSSSVRKTSGRKAASGAARGRSRKGSARGRTSR